MSGVTEAADGRPTTGDVAPADPPESKRPDPKQQPATLRSFGDADVRAALGGDDPAARDVLINHYGSILVAFGQARGAAKPDDTASGVILSLLREPASWPSEEAALRSALFRALRLRLASEADSAGDDFNGDEAIKSLTTDERDLVLLRAIGDLSLAQVGVVLDRPVHSVKVLQRQAIAALGHVVADPAGAP